MKRKILALLFVSVILTFIVIVAPRILTNEHVEDSNAIGIANNLHNAGHYTEAISIYEQLIEQGVYNDVIFYNLGNAYFENGDLGRAILNYQRAVKLNPRDEDIQNNLAVARALSTEIYPLEPSNPMEYITEVTSSWLSVNEIAILALIIWFLLLFLLMIWISLKPGKNRSGVQYGIVITFFLMVMIGLTLVSRIYIDQTRPDGIIVAQSVIISSLPDENSGTEFQLYSGAKVTVLDTQDEWVLMTIPGEVIEGWIPLDTVERVDIFPIFHNSLNLES
jgi:tetratricopeptide (TPR) repeat protein